MSKLKKEIETIVENSFNEFIQENNLVKVLFKKNENLNPIETLYNLNKQKVLMVKLGKDLNEKLFSQKESVKKDVEFANSLIKVKMTELNNDYYLI